MAAPRPGARWRPAPGCARLRDSAPTAAAALRSAAGLQTQFEVDALIGIPLSAGPAPGSPPARSLPPARPRRPLPPLPASTWCSTLARPPPPRVGARAGRRRVRARRPRPLTQWPARQSDNLCATVCNCRTPGFAVAQLRCVCAFRKKHPGAGFSAVGAVGKGLAWARRQQRGAASPPRSALPWPYPDIFGRSALRSTRCATKPGVL